MVESGVLKTYTFLYSENHSYLDKNLENMISVIEELKVRVLFLVYYRYHESQSSRLVCFSGGIGENLFAVTNFQ